MITPTKYDHSQAFFYQFMLSMMHRNGRASKNRGRLGSFDHHVSGCEVDVRGKGLMFKYVPTKLESEFLTGQN